jgi:hypothetical protein
MRVTAKLAALTVAGAITGAVPAIALAGTHPAHPAHPSHPTHRAHPSHPSHSHKCMVHKVAYTAYGTLVSWSATENSNGTYSGTIVVDVTKANHHARSDKGNATTYTLTDSRVRFGKGANPPAAGDGVKVLGKITAVAKKCADQSAAGAVTVRFLDVKLPKTSR